MKDYLAPAKAVSSFSEAKLEAYISAGNTIKNCSHGESGGMPAMYKEMISKAVRKANNKRKIKMIHENSSAAYATIQDLILTHQFEFLKIVKENPESTAREIELLSNGIPAPWKRLPELRFKGFVSNPYKRPCKVTGKKAMVWAAA